MKILSLLMVMFAGVASVSAAPAPGSPTKSFYFEYQSADAQMHLNCEHVSVNGKDSGDWTVICGKGTQNQREFGVHLVIQAITRETEPKMLVTILYSVSDRRTPNLSLYTSHVNSFAFKQEVDFQAIQLGQSVDNDFAYLYVTIGQAQAIAPAQRR